MLAVALMEAVAIGLLGLLVAGLLRSHAEILRRLHHLDGGTDPAPGAAPPAAGARPVPTGARRAPVRLSGESPGGEAVSLALDRPGEDTLLLFLSSGCGTCGPWWDGLRAGTHRHAAGFGRIIVVARGATEESPALLRGLAPPDVPVVLSSGAWEAFGVPGSPYAVLVDGSTGRVAGEGVARSWGQLESLVGQHVADLAAVAGRGRSGGETRADAELLEAGIGPGHPSLHPAPGSWSHEPG